MARSSPARFFGHPLTPQPVPLDRAERADAARRLDANDAAEADPAVLDRLVAMHRAVVDVQASLRRLGPELVWSGTAQTDSNGNWTKRFGREVRSLWLQCATLGTVTNSPLNAQGAPYQGPGVFVIPAANPAGQLFNADGSTSWTIYTPTPAQMLIVQAFATTAHP